jgi:hypothetical protein
VTISCFSSIEAKTISDSVDVTKKISTWMREFKKNNKKQFYSFRTADSTIVFGSNKKETFLTSVLLYDRKRNENRWYYYNEHEVFRISIQETPNRDKGQKKSKYYSYYFENGKLIFETQNDSKYVLASLLALAHAYEELAIPYLRPN